MHTRVDFKNTELNECQNTKRLHVVRFYLKFWKGKIIDTGQRVKGNNQMQDRRNVKGWGIIL